MKIGEKQKACKLVEKITFGQFSIEIIKKMDFNKIKFLLIESDA